MLAAVVMELHPDHPVKMPASHGSFAYAAALNILARLDPSLARTLHDRASRKPLTVGVLTGVTNRDGHDLVLTPEHTYHWRLTGLDPLLSSQLTRITPDLGKVRIGEATFAITSVATRAEDHHEAGQENYESVWARGAPGASPVTLRFVTPTTFREGRFEQPFPLPRWVFGSLLSTWNTFAPGPIGACRDLRELRELRELIEKGVTLSNWRGETRRVEAGGYRTVGFLGKFTYRVTNFSQEVGRVSSILAEYAFYAGVGWQTTQGMGQVRPASRQPPTPP